MPATPNRPTPRTNRNGAIGDYAAFKVEQPTLEHLLDIAISKSKPKSQPAAKIVAREGDFELRRYPLNSGELAGVCDACVDIDPARYDCTAVFGVVDSDGQAQIVFDVIDDRDDGPNIAFVYLAAELTVPNETVVAFLNYLDAPASWRAGADHKLAERFDAHWNKDAGGWELHEPQFLIKVAFARECFYTRPTLKETVDVFVAPRPGCDMENVDPEIAYDSKEIYRGAAWDEFYRLPQSEPIRAGFSSWMMQGDPVLIKVVGDGLNVEIDRLNAELVEESAPETDSPGLA